MDIDALKRKYFIPAVTPVDESRITPLLDAEEFNRELQIALDTVGTSTDPAANVDHFILIANWWLALLGGSWVPATYARPPAWVPNDEVNPPYALDPASGPSLIDVLFDKASRGVDVRAMGWVSYPVMDWKAAQLNPESPVAQHALTIASIYALRAHPNIGGKAILNVICHTAGGVHAKMIVIGNGTTVIGFTGGIDLVSDRWARTDHPVSESWHDVVAKVEGLAVQGLYDWFRLYWTENREQGGVPRDPIVVRINDTPIGHIVPAGSPGETPVLDAITFPPLSGGKHHVQSLRTIPARRYGLMSVKPPPDQLPEQGVFEVRDAWLQAIGAAERYIYLEDQAFWSAEMMKAIGDRVAANPALHVVLLTSGVPDPNDRFTYELQIWMSEAINGGLLKDLDASQRRRIRMFRRWGEAHVFPVEVVDVISTAPRTTILTDLDVPAGIGQDMLADGTWSLDMGPAHYLVTGNGIATGGGTIVLEVDTDVAGAVWEGPATVLKVEGITVHAKTTLIDDEWALIGSASCMRRALYTDVEHAVAVLDEDNVFVKEYRKRLWAHHFRGLPADFDDLNVALHAWEPTWFAPVVGPSRPVRVSELGPEYLQPMPLPIPTPFIITPQDRRYYDTYKDPDSRLRWSVSPVDLVPD